MGLTEQDCAAVEAGSTVTMQTETPEGGVVVRVGAKS